MTDEVQAQVYEKTVYDIATGQVLMCMKYTAYADEDPPGLPAGSAVSNEGCDEAVHYFPGGVKTDRPAMPTFPSVDTIVADDVDSVLFENLPAGAKVRVNGASEYQVDDGVFEYSTGNPGGHLFRIEAFPFVIEEFIVNASA